MHAALVALLTETVVHAPYTGQDSYGTPTYGAAVTLSARIEYTPRRILTTLGEERISRARVFLDGTVAVDLRDQLTLPDGTTPALQVVYPVRDLAGAVDHWEVSL